jgi:hypothetical protein
MGERWTLQGGVFDFELDVVLVMVLERVWA